MDAFDIQVSGLRGQGDNFSGEVVGEVAAVNFRVSFDEFFLVAGLEHGEGNVIHIQDVDQVQAPAEIRRSFVEVPFEIGDAALPQGGQIMNDPGIIPFPEGNGGFFEDAAEALLVAL